MGLFLVHNIFRLIWQPLPNEQIRVLAIVAKKELSKHWPLAALSLLSDQLLKLMIMRQFKPEQLDCS